MCVHVHTCESVYVSACMCMYVHMCVHVCACVCGVARRCAWVSGFGLHLRAHMSEKAAE